ncbi:CBS domain-containing protein [Myxococcota bacterium]|nr:CBS domain-containing protein [Myxococcota bacterium]
MAGKKAPKARDLMTEDPMTLDEDATVLDAIRVLQTLEIRHLPILNGRGELVGMISDRDLRDVRSSGPGSADDPEMQGSLRAPIRRLMSTDVVTVHPETGVAEVIDLMLATKVGALPVIDARSRDLVGIVSYIDLLRELRTALGA